MRVLRARTSQFTAVILIVLAAPRTVLAQGGQPVDQPAVTVRGQTYTPRSILARNMGTDEDQTTAFSPHKVIGNIYYVGTRTLSSFLIVTPQGHILINSTYERNVRAIRAIGHRAGFKFTDIKILLGNHAHGDHQEGDALVKQLTGAQVMVMAEDVPAMEAIKPGGKDHPIDRSATRRRDRDARRHASLVAHLTPGHTPGARRGRWQCRRAARPSTWSSAAAIARRERSVRRWRASSTVRSRASGPFPVTSRLGDHPAQSQPGGQVRPGEAGRSRILSSTRPAAGWKPTSRRRCSAPSSSFSRKRNSRRGDVAPG